MFLLLWCIILVIACVIIYCAVMAVFYIIGFILELLSDLFDW